MGELRWRPWDEEQVCGLGRDHVAEGVEGKEAGRTHSPEFLDSCPSLGLPGQAGTHVAPGEGAPAATAVMAPPAALQNTPVTCMPGPGNGGRTSAVTFHPYSLPTSTSHKKVAAPLLGLEVLSQQEKPMTG